MTSKKRPRSEPGSDALEGLVGGARQRIALCDAPVEEQLRAEPPRRRQALDYRLLADAVGLPGKRLRMDLVQQMPRDAVISLFGSLQVRDYCVHRTAADPRVRVNGRRVMATYLIVRLFNDDTHFEKKRLPDRHTPLLARVRGSVVHTCHAHGTHNGRMRCVNPDHLRVVPKGTYEQRRWLQRPSVVPTDGELLSLDGKAAMWNAYHSLCDRLANEPAGQRPGVRPVVVIVEEDEEEEEGDMGQWLVACDPDRVEARA